jgi:hypothetical protein
MILNHSCVRSFIAAFPIFVFTGVHAQISSGFSLSEITRIENTLASDDMQGRKTFTPGIEKAASFITHEFKSAGLESLPGSLDYRQTFTMVTPEATQATVTLNGAPVDQADIIALTADSVLAMNSGDDTQIIRIKNQHEFTEFQNRHFDSGRNYLVLVDTSLSARFKRLAARHSPQFINGGNRVLILTSSDPREFSVQVRQLSAIKKLTNLVGILPGKSRRLEYVIFSAHYDHLGIGKPDATGDSVYNGANDDASGTTAVITLAKYYSRMHNNERTLVFIAFTAEEFGEFGSTYFSKTMEPDKIIAMVNIEMIGTESKWGKNSAYITGFDKSDLGNILHRNLQGTQFRFYPDPYPDQNLFFRSDNASLAKRGVPAFTISTSKMDAEENYHQLSDEVKTLDLDNMTEIIQAISLSTVSIISGKDTPSRLVPE